MNLLPLIVLDALGALSGALVMAHLYRREGERSLLLWAVGFGCVGLGTVLLLQRTLWLGGEAALVASALAFTVGVVFIVSGTLAYVGRKPSARWGAVLLVPLLWYVVSLQIGMPFAHRAAPLALLLGAACIGAGVAVAHRWGRRRRGALVAAAGLILYGLHAADYPFLSDYESFAPWGYVLSTIFETLTWVGLVLLFMDRTKAQLAEREAHYRAVFDNAVAGIFVAADDGRLVAVNDALAVMLGDRATERHLGQPIEQFFVQPDEAAGLIQIEGDELLSKRCDWIDVNGDHLTIDLHARRVDDETLGHSIMGVVMDVSQVAQLEQQAQRAQKAEVLAQLAGGIAHDINNVLSVIVGGASVLERAVPPESLHWLEAIEESAERGAALTKQLLTFSRHHPTSPEPLEVGQLVQRCVRLTAASLGENVRLEVDTSPTGHGAMVDSSLFDQVVLNLLLNARDAMPEGGVIRVQVQRADDRAAVPPRVRESEAGYVIVAVSDTGTGMDEATAERIFEPFFTTKPLDEGSGLGLAMAQRAVTKAGGDIAVESTPGEGSTFRMVLPRVDVTTAAEPRPSAPVSATRGERSANIMVVEDLAPLRRVIMKVLVETGSSVDGFADAEAALAHLASGPVVDLLVTDMRLPGQDGIAVADALRELQPDVPVLFISGYATEGERLADLNDSHTQFLAKPFAMTRFLAIVEQMLALRHRRAVPKHPHAC